MALSTTTYALSKKYTDKSIEGLGAIKGAPCTIKSTTETSEGTEVVFEWTGTDGTTETKTITIKNGVSITGIGINNNKHLICTMSDGSTIDAGEVPNVKGDTGFSPTIEENPNNTDEIYKLDITNESGTFTTPNLKGTGGGLDPDRYYDKTQVDAFIEPLNEAKHTHGNKENVLDKLTTNSTGDTLLFNGQKISSVEIDDTTTTAADKVWSAKKTNDTIDEAKQSVTEVDNKFSNYDTSTEVDNKITNALADYSTTTEINTKLTDYAKTADVDTKLADYYKKTESYSNTEVDDKFTDFETTLTDNIKTWANSEESLAIKTALYNNNTLMFYKKPNATVDDIADFSINLPEEQFLDQTKTTFINNFIWSEELYPNSTNPNLDNQPVLVLAVKGDTDVVYSFVSMNELVKIYKASTTVSTVTLTIDDATNTISAEVNISADEGNLLKIGTDGGLYAKVTVDNTLSDTSENPVQNKVINVALNSKANLTDIPTELPADGGNADTVDGKHSYEITPYHPTNNRPYNTLTARIENVGNEVFKLALRDNDGNISSVAKFAAIADGGNADTLDGKHASDFSQVIDFGDTPTDTKIAIGNQRGLTTYRCMSWTDYPAEAGDSQGTIIAVSYYGAGVVGTDNMWVRQLYITPHYNYKIWQRIIADTTVGEWTNIADGGNADTVDGLHASDIQIDSVSDTAELVTLDGLQGDVPFSEIVVSGKNIFYGQLVAGMVGTTTGVIDSTSPDTTRYLSTTNLIPVKPNTQYTAQNAENKTLDAVVYYDENESLIGHTYISAAGFNSFTTPDNCKFVRWRYLFDSVQSDTSGLTNIQLEVGDTATEYELPIIGQEITLTTCGKNLIPYPYYHSGMSVNGVTISDNGDGSITVNGTATDNVVFYFAVRTTGKIILPNGEYFVSGCPKNSNLRIDVSYTNDSGTASELARDSGNGAGFTMPNSAPLSVGLVIFSGKTYDHITVRPQLERGDNATEYELYSGSTIIVTPDSNPYTVPNDIRQLDGINNVSVSAGKISVTGVKRNAAVKKIWGNKADLSDIQIDSASDAAEMVTLDGLQGGVPFSDITVSGKNLITEVLSAALGGNSTDGFRITDNPYCRSFVQKLLPNTTYTVKRYDGGNRFRIILFNEYPTITADTTANQILNATTTPNEWTFTTGSDHLWFALTTHNGATDKTIVEPIVQLEYGDTATEYEEPIIGQEITLCVCGKNLFELTQGTITKNGITFTNNGDGSFNVSGTATVGFGYVLGEIDTNFVKNHVIYFSLRNAKFDIKGFNLTLKIQKNGGDAVYYAPDCMIDFDGNPDNARVVLWFEAGVAMDYANCKVQIELGNTATEYELYSGSETTVNPDSNPYTVPNDIRQQDGINNVSVSAGEVSVTGVKKNAAIKKIWDNKADLSDIQIDTVSDTAGIVTLDGLQGGVPFSSITVSSKNMIDLTDPTSSHGEGTADGSSDSLTVSYSSSIARTWTYIAYGVAVKPNTVYHIKCTADEGSGTSGVSVTVFAKDPSPSLGYKWGSSNFDVAFNSGNNDRVFIRFYSNASHTAMTESSVSYHNIMLSEDENAEYVPEIIGQKITLTACGKNLLEYPYASPAKTENGITFTDNGDGSIIVNGTATDNASFYTSFPLVLPIGEYTVSDGNHSAVSEGCHIQVLTYFRPYTALATTFTNKSFVLTKPTALAVRIFVLNGYTGDNLVIKPQIERGREATDYQSFSGSVTAITPDSNPYTVPNDIRQQDGINNVSVSAGEVSVTGVKKSPVINRAWEELDSHTNNTTVHVTAEEKAAWNAVNYSNPNLLINPDFAINQRGKSDYTTGFSVDCWKCNNITLNANGGTITLMKADGISGGELAQNIEVAYKSLVGKTLTISCADVDGNIIKGTATIPAEQPTATTNLISASLGDIWITFSWSDAGRFYFRIWLRGSAALTYSPAWCKVEVGEVATPFVPPNPATELLKCQRYYQIRSTGNIPAVDLRPSMATISDIKQREDGNYEYIAEL